MEKALKIVILDSAIDVTHPYFKNINIITYTKKNGSWEQQECVKREGHGTAVCGIIAKNSINSEIVSFDIFDKNLRTEHSNIVEALTYIYHNIECDIINLSLGLRNINQPMYNICKKLYEKGIILVSAFDNAGGVSYPAAYPFVIGVDASFRCTHADDFIFVKNSIVNIRAKGGNQRVAWVNPQYTINQGSSFAAPYVTAYITKLIHNGVSKNNILSEFEKIARYTYDWNGEYKKEESGSEEAEKTNTIIENIKKETVNKAERNYKSAALYPYNKEIHSFIHYPDLLNFKIQGIYDNKYSGKIGLQVSSMNLKDHYIIRNIEQIDWENIDVLIIGHLSEMESYSVKKLKVDILHKCLINHINVYCFDDASIEEELLLQFEKEGLSIDWAGREINRIGNNKFGKLYQIKAPVLGVFGTTRQQGKYTLQLHMRRLLKEYGYSICQMGSEPSSLLFGMDEIYPFGYNATVHMNPYESIEYLNERMHTMDIKEPDLIIVGSQSGTIPMMYYNIGQLPLEQMHFLLGVKPDGVVLCVNLSDNCSYIKRTIAGIESLVNCKVICLAVYPIEYKDGWAIISENKKEAEIARIDNFMKELNSAIGLKSFIIGNDAETRELLDTCIQFFTK